VNERIHKVIARSGLASRRRAEDLVGAGRVTIDGKPARIGQKIDPGTARVEVDGVPLPVRPGLVHLLVNKPVDVVSTVNDPQGRPTVVGLVASDTRVYPVGRLDADSEGLLILTNDGDLANRLTHPRFGVDKTYTVLVEGSVPDAALRDLTDGVALDDGPAAARAVRVVDRRPGKTLLEIVMREGRNREVRRMCDAVGHPVQRLVRTAIGPLSDRTLRPGESRPLSIDEVRALYAASGGSWQDASRQD
jgi:23S rRNA pseudouridine2605 synthase